MTGVQTCALPIFSNLVPRFALFSIYNSFILPIFDYGSVVYDTCSQSDAYRLLDSAQTTAAKIITGCIKTTANDAVLNDISLVKLCSRAHVTSTTYEPSLKNKTTEQVAGQLLKG